MGWSGVNQGSGFSNKLMQKWLDENDILMYLTYNEGNSVAAERFIRTLKGKINKKWLLVMVNLFLVTSVR